MRRLRWNGGLGSPKGACGYPHAMLAKPLPAGERSQHNTLPHPAPESYPPDPTKFRFDLWQKYRLGEKLSQPAGGSQLCCPRSLRHCSSFACPHSLAKNACICGSKAWAKSLRTDTGNGDLTCTECSIWLSLLAFPPPVWFFPPSRYSR